MHSTRLVDAALATIHDIISGIATHMDAIQQRRFQVAWKEDRSPVTKADTYIESLIYSHLSALDKDILFISEEAYKSVSPDQLSTGWVSVLDPIDGTENFCSGLKEWGISLGLWFDGRHQASLLLMPEINEMLITGTPPRFVRSRIRGYSSSMCPEIQEALVSGGEFRIMGCAVYNLLNVIRGSFSRFTNPKGAYIWDLLPGLMLALEHNCEVKVNEQPYDGHFLDPDCRYRIDIQHRYDLHSG